VLLALPEKAQFELRATTNRGRLENEFGSAFSIDERREGGTLSGRTGDGANMTVTVGRGSITLRKSSGDMFVQPVPPRAVEPRPPRGVDPPEPPKVRGERT
jgi:hypothetical protein